jgi:hypothetical protein
MTSTSWLEEATAVVKRARGVLNDYSSLQQIIHSVLPEKFLHYFCAQPELQALYPRFLMHSWLEQVQMVLTMWFLRVRRFASPGEVDFNLWIKVLHWGGISPTPSYLQVRHPSRKGSSARRYSSHPPPT